MEEKVNKQHKETGSRKMINGLSLGLGIFSFIVSIFCFYLSTIVDEPTLFAIYVMFGATNGLLGAFNIREAFL